MHERFGGRGLTIVGVHTPEFDHEKSRKNVEAAVEKYELGGHSHLLDNHMKYWRALRNQYWPAIYVIDGQGRIRDRLFGEVHVGTSRDKDVSKLVETLLAENATPKS
jgi:hypothetical protein